MPVRRHEPVYVSPRATSYGSSHDYGIEDTINRADYLSQSVLQDTYEAAKYSRGKDHALLRNVNAAIQSPNRSREHAPRRSSRLTKRVQSLPPVDIRPTSSSSHSHRALVPYTNTDRTRSPIALATPSPSSLLSSRINSYLRGSSASPSPTRNSLYRSLVPGRFSSLRDLSSSLTPHRSYASDPHLSISSSAIRNLAPSTLTPTLYRSISPLRSRVKPITYNNEADLGSDNEDYDPDIDYTRKYKIIKYPVGSSMESKLRRVGGSGITYSRSGSPDGSYEEDDYSEILLDDYNNYSCPRPSGTSQLKLSSYDGDYDGSYDADMAEMYDYVPYGPSRRGILELTENEENHRPYSYIESSGRSLSPSVLSKTTISTVPPSSRNLDDSLTRYQQANSFLDSLISSTAARAKKVLEDSKLPEYKNASLVLSFEGSAVSEDGKNKYGFRYYPPPIPLKGSHIGLDERILSIAPKSISPADSFLATYLNKLKDIRTDVRDSVDKSEYGRYRSSKGSSSALPIRRSNDYVHSTLHVPVQLEGRPLTVPVSSYRSRYGDGHLHRVDVFPLVVSETRLPSGKKLQLPYYTAGGGSGASVGVGAGRGSASPSRLTVLEKINIKAAIIGSRLDAGDTGRSYRRPRSEYALNKLRREESERRYI